MKLALGTAQFGMDYGISNQVGQTPPAAVAEILAFSRQNGISLLDTAHSYGNAEATLGKLLGESSSFKIISKTPPFSSDVISKNDATQLRDCLSQTLTRLNISSVEGLLVHRCDDLLRDHGDFLYQEMVNQKAAGKAKMIGISAYDPEQVLEVTKRYAIDVVQIPLNVFDQRMLSSGTLELLKSKGIEVHARSLFLQGLVLMSTDELPAFLKPMAPLLESFHRLISKYRLTALEGALAFVRSIPQIDYAVVGVNTLEQLKHIVRCFASEENGITGSDFAILATSNPNLINPSRWSP